MTVYIKDRKLLTETNQLRCGCCEAPVPQCFNNATWNNQPTQYTPDQHDWVDGGYWQELGSFDVVQYNGSSVTLGPSNWYVAQSSGLHARFGITQPFDEVTWELTVADWFGPRLFPQVTIAFKGINQNDFPYYDTNRWVEIRSNNDSWNIWMFGELVGVAPTTKGDTFIVTTRKSADDAQVQLVPGSGQTQVWDRPRAGISIPFGCNVGLLISAYHVSSDYVTFNNGQLTSA